MKATGKRLKRIKLIRSKRFIVAVEIEMVIPASDPSEPCMEAATVNHLKEVQQHADAGDRNWLMKRGHVYELVAQPKSSVKNGRSSSVIAHQAAKKPRVKAS